MESMIKNAEVVARNGNLLQINIESVAKTPMTLYWTTEAQPKPAHKTYLQNVTNGTVEVVDPLSAKQRIYFIIEQDGQPPFLFAERTLPASGMTNFRDYGGYLGAGGKRVKWGILYRSNHLYGLSKQAEHYLNALKIKTIVDYRSDHEIEKSPNQFIGEERTYNLDPSAHTAELAAQFAAKPNDENQALIDTISSIAKEKVNGKGEQVLEQYRNFVLSDKSKKAYQQLIQIMLDAKNVPSVQHCRGGKDRTGHGVLLIQTMLGVSKTDIIYDYMLTKNNRLARNETKMAEYREITNDENVLGYLLSLIDTREQFVKEIFNTMEQVAGSAENYIKQELGFTDQDFKTMQDNYLEQ